MNNAEVIETILNLPREAAERWVNAVNADGKRGHWSYAVAKLPMEWLVC